MLRKNIEIITASLVVFLLTAFTFIFILIIANFTFQWDIFPPFIEKLLYFLSGSMLIIIVSSVMINIMINISRLSFFAEIIAKKLSSEEKK